MKILSDKVYKIFVKYILLKKLKKHFSDILRKFLYFMKLFRIFYKNFWDIMKI